MNRRAIAAVLASLLTASSSSAQTIGSVVAPRLSGSVPTIVIPGAALNGVAGAMPVLSPLALTSALPMPVIAPALVAVPVAAAPLALNSARALTVALAAASADGKDQTPALAAAFDGLKAASTSDDVAVPSFIDEARRRFVDLRRSEDEAARAARPEGAIPSDDDLQGRMDRLPSTNPERMKFMVDLFKLGGATDADIKLQDAGRGRNNVIVTIKGKTDRVIVIGGHYDKVSEGLGKIDNGTGSTMVANLYQAMHGTQPDATLVFIAFAREEEGLYGSQAYVKSLDKAARSKIDAMINMDTLAVDGTFSWKNNSTRALLDRFAQVSRESGHAMKEDYLNGGDADSSTFRDAGIPAVTIYGASQDVIFDIIHSERDNMSAFNLAHYKNAYLLVLEAIKSLDRTPLGPVGRGSI
ncbi:MAG: M20/M25/M40 family metallo-hydrolase [Elusimicrobia bacterium]|nr:M20/M25/M40 family metallo-hydrolase [Elusimicrobiota bacterium]